MSKQLEQALNDRDLRLLDIGIAYRQAEGSREERIRAVGRRLWIADALVTEALRELEKDG